MLNIPCRFYSRAVWDTIHYRTQHIQLSDAWYQLKRGDATISDYTGLMLKKLAWLLKPKLVYEVGTYTGRSATAIMEGMDGGHIHTCDATNDLFTNRGIIQFHRMMSTEMFNSLTEKADFIFLDGRLPADDLPHIMRLSHPETVIAFDDFEVIEKGVANAMLLAGMGKLIVVPEPGQTLALMLPKISLSRQ